MKTFRLFLFALAVFLAATSVSLGEEPDAYAAELQRARSLLAGGKNEDAIQSFKRANKLRNNASVECHLGLAQAYQNLGAWKNAVKSADQVLERATDTDTRVQAHNLKGMVFMGQAKDKPDKLKDAEQSFRAALELKPDYAPTRYNLGVALLKQGRDPEGITELETYLKLSPSGVRADEARRYIENPRRARENFAPEFSLTTAGGEYFSLDDLQGKVVLLDFWATWCKPCIAALPDLKGVHKKYSKEAGDNFILISLSWDNDEDKWRSYIQKEGMEWAHYLDRDHRLGRLFNVRAIPTYILIDGEGIIRHQAVGTFETVFIGGEVKKSLKALADQQPGGQK